MMTVSETRTELLRAMRLTARARFSANKRLESVDRRLTWLTALTSAYVIILTIVPYILKSPPCLADLFNVITVFFSIIVVVTALIQYSSQNALFAEQHHRSALEINEIRRDLEFVDAAALTALFVEKIISRYDNILQKYSVNHDNVDNNKATIEKPEENPWISSSWRWKVRWQIFWAYYTPSIFSCLVTAAIVGLVSLSLMSPCRLCFGRECRLQEHNQEGVMHPDTSSGRSRDKLGESSSSQPGVEPVIRSARNNGGA